MFKNKSIMKQKGFTLLELLVVITLLAILAVGGLVAYDGVGENAEAAAASYNAGTLDRAVRQYRAVTNAYPDQWDNLSHPTATQAVGSTASGSASTENDQFLPLRTRQLFGSYNLGTSTLSAAVINVVENQWGMEEIQHNPTVFDPAAGVAPGKFHNEGTNAGAVETEWADAGGVDFTNISVLVTANGNGAGTFCTVGGTAITRWETTNTAAETALIQNAMNDAMGIERCHFTIALGFGGDAASSTSRASVSIPAAPTYSSDNVNVSQNYGRYIGLFHMGRTDSGAGQTDVTELFARPKLIGFVDTEGNPVDVNIARTRSDTAE